MYGSDQYIRQYELEIGVPWKATEAWIRISYPFFKADRIKTPTLFMGGEKDFNVPIIGGEQMYQALKSLGVETQLVVYPGQFHGIRTPSYVKDLLRALPGLVRQVPEAREIEESSQPRGTRTNQHLGMNGQNAGSPR